MPHMPKYQFGSPVGKWVKCFAWLPVKLWDGRWVWLRKYSMMKIIKKSYLDGADLEFWHRTDY